MLKHIEVISKDKYGNKKSIYECSFCLKRITRQGTRDKNTSCGCKSNSYENRELPAGSNFTPLSKIGPQSSKVRVLCKCGAISEITVGGLFKESKGYCKSCKHLSLTVMVNGFKLREHPAYSSLDGMKQRCYNKDSSNYKWYGNKGITICKEWRSSYRTFCLWADSNGFKKGLTIDRIDPEGNYCPSNCRWASKTDQRDNKRVQHNNTTGYAGVSFMKSLGKYESYYTKDKVKYRCGFYDTAKEASEAREKALGLANINYVRKG
jgi:hypothetical protein